MTGPEDMKEVIQRIVEKLAAEYAPLKVILFGSYAWGTPGPDSDIDLLIVKETSERPMDRWSTVGCLIDGVHRSIPVEPIVLAPREIEQRLVAGDVFIRKILEKGKVLYAK